MLDNVSNPPNGSEGSEGAGSESIQDIQTEIQENFTKFKTDSKYRKEIQARTERAAKNSEFVDKIGG